MNMKKLILFLICVFVGAWALAQTQHGVVKTRGRLVAGRHKSGQGLTGATVHIQGRTSVVVENRNGSFSFPIPGKSFKIESVRKKGYQLVDADAAPKVYTYSTSPIILVMDTPDQLLEDKLATQRQINKAMTRDLNRKENEINELKRQNKVSQQQYLQQIQDLYDQQDKNAMLVRRMAEYYATIDYDMLDDFNRRVGVFILNGNLASADSLLRTKGDMNERINELNQLHEANVISREMVEKSEMVEKTQREDIARDCFSFFQRFALAHENDSATYYIEKRAGLDAMNPQWQADAGSYLQQRGLADKAAQYYRKAIDASRGLAQTDPGRYEPLLARTLNNIAMLYSESAQPSMAEPLFDEAIGIYRRLASADTLTFKPLLASVLNNLAVLYSRESRDLSTIERLYNDALDIYMPLSQEMPEIYGPAVASTFNNLALLYGAAGGRFYDSELMFSKALALYRQLGKADSGAYLADYAATLINLSTLYYRNDLNIEKAISLLDESLGVYRHLSEADSQYYAPMMATALNNLSVLYFATSDPEKGERALIESLELYKQLAYENPVRYLPLIADRAYQQGVRCYQDDEMEKSKTLFGIALDAYSALEILNPDRYRPEKAKLLRNMAAACDKLRQWDDAGRYYQEELDINQELARLSPRDYNSHVARSYGNLSNHALLTGNFIKAAEYARAGLDIDSTKTYIRANLAAALLFMGEREQAMSIYQEYKQELRDTFLDDFRQFEAIGIIPDNARQAVEQIKQSLNQ